MALVKRPGRRIQHADWYLGRWTPSPAPILISDSVQETVLNPTLTPTPNPSSGQPPSFPTGKTVRFAIFSEGGRRSSTWVAGTSKHKLDAYSQHLPFHHSRKGVSPTEAAQKASDNVIAP
jgi:hypothetical protein